jgi:hypothetical protein
MGYDLYRPGELNRARVNKAVESYLKQRSEVPLSIADVERAGETSYRFAEETGLYFRFNVQNWRYFIPLAVEFSWEPKLEIDCYLGNQGQLVDSEDAANLGDALERAAEFAKNLKEQGIASTDENLQRMSDEWFQDKISRFAAFCRGGEFEIY